MAALFRMACTPGAIAGTPGWAAETLREGEVALLIDGGGLDAINAAAHMLGQVTVSIVRSEADAAAQEQTVMRFAGSLPFVWVGPHFGCTVEQWARERGPMTLLVGSDGPLPDDERGRIARFLALLGRQTE